MNVLIYKTPKTTMQSGRAKFGQWVLQARSENPHIPNALMGWITAGDTNNQIRIEFDAEEDAIRFAEEKGWEYTVLPEQNRKNFRSNYADNFVYNPPSTVKKPVVRKKTTKKT